MINVHYFFIYFTEAGIGFLLFSKTGCNISKSIVSNILIANCIKPSGSINGNIDNLQVDKVIIKSSITNVSIEEFHLKWSYCCFHLKINYLLNILLLKSSCKNLYSQYY